DQISIVWRCFSAKHSRASRSLPLERVNRAKQSSASSRSRATFAAAARSDDTFWPVEQPARTTSPTVAANRAAGSVLWRGHIRTSMARPASMTRLPVDLLKPRAKLVALLLLVLRAIGLDTLRDLEAIPFAQLARRLELLEITDRAAEVADLRGLLARPVVRLRNDRVASREVGF